MNPEEYAKALGLKCPACGAGVQHIRDEGHWDWCEEIAYKPCGCDKCGASWVDRYRLEGFDSLETKAEKTD